MELTTINVGIVSEIDAAKLRAKVTFYGMDDEPTDWLMIMSNSGFYYMPAVGDQALVAMDETFDTGVIIGYVNNEQPYSTENTIGIKFAGVEIEIDRKAGATRIKLTGDASIEMPNLLIKGKVKIDGDMEITGKSKLTGDVTADGKVDAKGIIKSLVDVQTSTVKLNTHLHVSAAPGSPTTPPTPGT